MANVKIEYSEFIQNTNTVMKRLENFYCKPLVVDMNKNLNTLVSNVTTYCQEGFSIQDIVDDEIKRNDCKKSIVLQEGKTCLSMIWLIRGLKFAVNTLELLVKTEKPVPNCVETSYMKNLEMFHSPAEKTAFWALFKICPTDREDTLQRLGHPTEEELNKLKVMVITILRFLQKRELTI